MVLALQNNLTKYAVGEISHANIKMHGLNDSIATGKNELITPVNFTLGNSLQDKNILFRNITKNLSYGFNLFLVADKSLSSIASELSLCLNIIASAKTVSSDKLEVLQQSLKEKIQHINLLINNTNFDGRALLKDGTNINMQIGTRISDGISIRIERLEGKLFRNNATNALNKYLGAQLGRVGGYDTQEALDEAVLARVNFTQADIDDLDEVQLSQAIVAARDGNEFFLNLDNGIPRINDVLEVQYTNALRLKLHNTPGVDANIIEDVVDQVRREMVPDITDIKEIAERIERIGGIIARDVFLSYNIFHATLQAADQQDIEDSLVDPQDRDELIALLRDNQLISLATSVDRTSAQDIILSALSIIRTIQSDVVRQKTNIIQMLNILKSRHNVIEQAADSYLKTDYVLTSQQLAEEIKHMTGSITMLQAGNKLQETVLKLLETLD